MTRPGTVARAAAWAAVRVGVWAAWAAALATVATAQTDAGDDIAEKFRPMLEAEAPPAEHYRDEVTVSGGIRAGVLLGDLDAALDLARLNVYLPVTDFDTLCLEAISSSARYTAKTSYSITGREPGVYRLQFKTRYGDFLRRLRARELGVLVRLRNAEDGCEPTRAEDPLLAVSWGEPVAPEAVSVLLNSGGLLTWLRVPGVDDAGATTNRRLRCRSIDLEERVAYDTECRFELSPCDRLEDLEILRRDGDGFPEPVALSLRVPR